MSSPDSISSILCNPPVRFCVPGGFLWYKYCLKSQPYFASLKGMENSTLPACVMPRRRFLRWFLAALSLITLGCILVRFYAVYYPNWTVLGRDLELACPLMLLVFGPLLIPVRTVRGSMLQLLGLVCAVLLSLVICIFNWDPSISGAPDLTRLAYVMLVGWTALPIFFYLYVPICLLHLLLCFIEKRKQRK